MTPNAPYVAAEGLDVESLLRDEIAATPSEPRFEGAAIADRYARAALERECEDVARAGKGTRNKALNDAAFSLGQLVAGGALDADVVRTALRDAAAACGLAPSEVRKTIESGLRGGEKHPRQRPEPRLEHTRQLASTQPSEPLVAPYLLSEMIGRIGPIGQRLSTGLTVLDEATRGGLPLGRVVMLLGAPGAAKTTLACWWLDSFERQGCACCFLAADEPSEGIVTRLGQVDGWSRGALESEGDAGDAVRGGFRQRAHGRPIIVIDPDADEQLSTIEDAEAALLRLAGNRPRVLIVDSLQTVRCRAAECLDSQRERIDAKIAVLKAIAKRETLVVAISEMARGAYRSGDRSQDTSALAAGKESGAIEYGASLLLGLRSVKGEQGLVDVEVAKNRLGGSKPEFRIRLDFERATFAPAVMPDPEEQREEQEDAKAQRARARVIEAVKRKELKTKDELCVEAGGRRSETWRAITKLTVEGVLVQVAGVFRLDVSEAP